MKDKSRLTPRLRQNWWIDALMGISALLVLLSSLYFLAFPDGGYQGGRNPFYDLRVIFSRQTWDLLHTYTGALMIFSALIHIIIHWQWIIGTVKRTWQVITRQRAGFGLRLTYNILLDLTIAIGFLVCAVSGLAFMFFPASGSAGAMPVFDKYTWDMLHTWSGVLMAIAAVLHFALHWKWIVNITGKMFPGRQKEISSGEPGLSLESGS